jgi:hypothetical protein
MAENRDNEDLGKEKKGEGEGWRSDVFIGKTRAKIWTLYAVFLDTVMLGGQVPFTLRPSPYGDLEEDEEVEERQEAMRDRIKEQLRDRHADREYMKAWLSMGVYGEAWKKYDVQGITRRIFRKRSYAEGPFARFADASAYTSYELEESEESVPGWRYVSVWDLFWDLEEWEPQDMNFIFERIPSSVYDLRELMEEEGYLKEEIEEVIEEAKEAKAEKDTSLRPGLRDLADRKRSLNRYAFCMRVPRRLAEEFERDQKGKDILSMDEEDGREVYIMGEIVKGRVIQYVRSSGWKPYLRCPLEIDLDGLSARGVPDNMEGVQRFLNGAVRAFWDNKRLTANAMMAVKRRFFSKPGELDSTYPGKQFDISDECDDVRKAIMPIVLPDVGESLISAINLAEKWVDDVSMIPTFLQGFTLPKHKADTAFEMNQLQQNAGKYIGQAIRNNDEFFIEPEITVLYEYNMMDPDFEPKGNFKVHAGGFNSFQSRVLKVEEIKGVLALLLSNEMLMKEAKLRPHLEVLYKGVDEDPDDFLKTEEEKMAEAEQEMKMQERARFQAIEEMRAETQLEIEKERAKGEIDKEKEALKSELDREEETHKSMLERQEQEEEFELEQEAKLADEVYGDSRGTAQEDRV